MTTPQTVTVLRRRDFTAAPGPGQITQLEAITYRLPGLPPQVAILEKKDRTPEELRRDLLDHAARRTRQPPVEL